MWAPRVNETSQDFYNDAPLYHDTQQWGNGCGVLKDAELLNMCHQIFDMHVHNLKHSAIITDHKKDK